MTITALHVPHGHAPLAVVTVRERDVLSYYPYVQGGPAEAALLSHAAFDLKVYVNSRYAELDGTLENPRLTTLFRSAGSALIGGTLLGDGLIVLAPGRGSYDRSLPGECITLLTARL